jgi:DNA-binding response OmpR family regulator
VEETGQNSIKNSNTVMICDDDYDLLNLFQKGIGSKYSVIAIDSGTECISRYIDEKAKGNKIDVLIVNYDLHDLPGDIVATTIRDLNGDSIGRTILLSASELDIELIEDLKIKNCVTDSARKPVFIESLMKIIEPLPDKQVEKDFLLMQNVQQSVGFLPPFL